VRRCLCTGGGSKPDGRDASERRTAANKVEASAAVAAAPDGTHGSCRSCHGRAPLLLLERHASAAAVTGLGAVADARDAYAIATAASRHGRPQDRAAHRDLPAGDDGRSHALAGAAPTGQLGRRVVARPTQARTPAPTMRPTPFASRRHAHTRARAYLLLALGASRFMAAYLVAASTFAIGGLVVYSVSSVALQSALRNMGVLGYAVYMAMLSN